MPDHRIIVRRGPRLGAVDLILISHAHSDHLGNAKLNQDPNSNSASCSSAATLPAPSSNTAEIAAGKHSAALAGGPLATVIGRLIAALTGSATPGCPASGPTNEMTVPRATPCAAGLGPEEAAFAITELVRPATAIPSHVNEAATQGGVAIEGSKTARFADLVRKGNGNVAVQLLRRADGSARGDRPLFCAVLQ